MTFLNPTALFALLAAAFPVILHFINLRKLKRIEISSLAFLKELQKNKIRKVKLKQWLLLLLRILIIASLVLAFSKPALRPNGIFSSGAKTSAVIIIDNSFSMSPVDEGGSLFNKAKQAASKLIDSFKPGDEIKILFTCGMENGERAATDFYRVKKSIDGVQISSVSTPLLTSFIGAGKILSESGSINKELYIISDFQKSTISSGPEIEKGLSGLLPPYARVYLIEPTEGKTGNLSLTGLTAENRICESGKDVSFKAVVSNYSYDKVENGVASLFINGKRCAQQGVSLKKGETKELFFETELKETGLLDISVVLEEDDIEYDNSRYTSVFVPEKINIGIYSDTQEDLAYIDLALEAAGENIFSVTQKNFAQLNPADLTRFNPLILCGSEKITDFSPFRNFLSSGGSIITFPGSRSTLISYNNLCSALNIPKAEAFVKGLRTSNAQVFDKFDFAHPVPAGIFEKGITGKPSSPEFFSYFKISRSTGNEVIGFAGGAPFLVETASGSGRVLQFAAPPILSYTNFPAKAIFAPLIQRSILYMSVRYPDQTDKTAGSPLYISSRDAKSGIKAELPGGETIILNQPGSGPTVLTRTEKPGLYKFYYNGKLIDFSSLNFDAKETVLERLTAGGFKDFLKERKIENPINVLNLKNDLQQEVESARFGTELWKHFLVLALLFVLAEMAVSRTRRKDLE